MNTSHCKQSANQAFDSLLKKLPPQGDSTNADSTILAWTTSYVLMGYMAMFRASRDTHYLDVVYQYILNMLKNRDDVLCLEDQIRGKILPAWSSDHYTQGKNYCWIVHNGMITYPIMVWAGAVKSDTGLHERYLDKANYLILKVKETVDAFNPDWRQDGDPNEGYFFGAFYDKPLPLNQQNALGRTMILLGEYSQESHYTQKAKQLAQFFLNRVNLIDDRYVWDYWPGVTDVSAHESPLGFLRPELLSETIEDISHGAIDVDFAYVAHAHSLVFSDTDMERFVATFMHCMNPDGFYKFINATGGLGDSVQMGRWGHLAYTDQSVNEALCRYYQKNEWASGTTASFLAAGYLSETLKA